MEYIDIVLTQDGVFCVAPPWTVNVGDLVCLPDVLKGTPRILDVISVATDATDGEHIKMLEKFVGYPLPKITAKYLKRGVDWEGEQDAVVSE